MWEVYNWQQRHSNISPLKQVYVSVELVDQPQCNFTIVNDSTPLVKEFTSNYVHIRKHGCEWLNRIVVFCCVHIRFQWIRPTITSTVCAHHVYKHSCDDNNECPIYLQYHMINMTHTPKLTCSPYLWHILVFGDYFSILQVTWRCFNISQTAMCLRIYMTCNISWVMVKTNPKPSLWFPMILCKL